MVGNHVDVEKFGEVARMDIPQEGKNNLGPSRLF